MRQSEDHMVVRRWQQFIYPCLDPLFLFHAPAIWAMPVTATMVLQMLVFAMRLCALVMVHAYTGCMAFAQPAENSLAIRIERLDCRVSKKLLELVYNGHATTTSASNGDISAARFFF